MRVLFSIILICFCLLGTRIYSKFLLSGKSAFAAQSTDLSIPDESIDEDSNYIEDQFQNFSSTEVKILLNLRSRHNKLKQLESDLENKEVIINSTKEYLENRIKELKSLQSSVEEMLSEYRKIEEEKIKSLVKIYENMKPIEAALILENLDNATLLEVFDYMKEVKAAPILAKMRLDKAKEITFLLANESKRLRQEGNVCSCDLILSE